MDQVLALLSRSCGPGTAAATFIRDPPPDAEAPASSLAFAEARLPRGHRWRPGSLHNCTHVKDCSVLASQVTPRSCSVRRALVQAALLAPRHRHVSSAFAEARLPRGHRQRPGSSLHGSPHSEDGSALARWLLLRAWGSVTG